MVDTDIHIITSRASCRECEFDNVGREAPTLAVAHVKETGHTVTLNTSTFTTITKGEQDG